MSKDTTSDHLRAELKSLADTLEEVLSSSSSKSKEELSKLRNKAEQARMRAATVWAKPAMCWRNRPVKPLRAPMSTYVKIRGPG